MDRRVLYIVCMMMFVVCATSCSENTDIVDGYVDVEISTTIEANYMNEEYSRADISYYADNDAYDMRYTIELWSGDYSEAIYQAEAVVKDVTASLTHSFRAVAGDYRLVIFADYVKDGYTVANDNETSHYNTSNGLDKIVILAVNYSYQANDPSRDCYGYSENITIDSSFSLNGITLKRPMAKMTLADVEPTNVELEKSVEITYNTSIPYGYDLLNGEVITGEEVTVSYPTTEDNQEILAYDYIFISDPTSYLMTFEVGDKDVSATINFEQNKTTNITATFFE